ncbi:unnamed protein product [Heterobilharzia americana]|nr:unnamed protein product [Heterobilharzia americana]
MDDRPVSGVGAYKVNWDEIDELSNPFANGGKGIPSQHRPKAVLKPSAHGDVSNDDTKQSNLLPPDAELEKPPKQSLQKSKPVNQTLPKPNSSTEVQQSLNLPSSTAISDQDNPKTIQNENILQCNGETLSVANPQLIPSPEKISEALQSVINDQSNKTADDNDHSEVDDDVSYEAEQILDEPVENSFDNDRKNKIVPDVMQTSRIDSSTRPASPAQPGMLNKSDNNVKNNNNNNNNNTTVSLNGKDNFQLPPQHPSKISRDIKTLNDTELTALRNERDQLLLTIEEMKHCITEYDRSLQHMIEEKAISQNQMNVPVSDLIKERDEAVEELATIEKAFGDLHRRFEKSKQIIEGFKQNEDALKRSIEEYKSLLQRQERKYLALKSMLKINC